MWGRKGTKAWRERAGCGRSGQKDWYEECKARRLCDLTWRGILPGDFRMQISPHMGVECDPEPRQGPEPNGPPGTLVDPAASSYCTGLSETT
jgi:hypothetical protein